MLNYISHKKLKDGTFSKKDLIGEISDLRTLKRSIELAAYLKSFSKFSLQNMKKEYTENRNIIIDLAKSFK